MERSQFVEVRWHARAGQGVVTAAKTLAETALREVKYGQAFPEYGPERSGAPIKAYNRISDLPIRIYSQVLEPDVVIVSDPTLLRSEQILAGAKDNTIVIVNSPDPPETVASRIGSGKLRVYVVNASQIAFEETKKHFPHPPLLGALIPATD